MKASRSVVSRTGCSCWIQCGSFASAPAWEAFPRHMFRSASEPAVPLADEDARGFVVGTFGLRFIDPVGLFLLSAVVLRGGRAFAQRDVV
jgi:hypothetical protein